jgi:retron-type reverse transcriptase
MIVQKAMQLTLQAIFEPSFLDCSHGFRPNKGCHTALKTIKPNFKGINWVIEADIEKCFDNIDHKVLLNLL